MPILLGTCGWSYRDWRGVFYPEKLPQRAWLDHYAEHYATVELDNAFYRLPSYDTFQAWHERLPADVVVAVKASRFLTHIRRLREPVEPVHRLMEHAAGLQGHLGPILVQLPPNLRAEPDRLAECLAAFPTGTRVAVEPRHESWWTDDVRRLLERHGAALTWADRLGRPVTPLWRTTDWGYVRFHEGRAQPWPRYGRAALASWIDRIAAAFDDGADVHVYFNNDPGGAAVSDAATLGRIAARAGRTVTRTPNSS
jgi:uncharacterized protein YecE (DUF72 family)